jgi:hypothetical protein
MSQKTQTPGIKINKNKSLSLNFQKIGMLTCFAAQAVG